MSIFTSEQTLRCSEVLSTFEPSLAGCEVIFTSFCKVQHSHSLILGCADGQLLFFDPTDTGVSSSTLKYA